MAVRISTRGRKQGGEVQQKVERLWLRWYDEQGNWISTPTEQEKQRADNAELEILKLKKLLAKSGIEIPEQEI